MCRIVASVMRDGYCDILAKGSNSHSVEETSEGDVRGVSGFAFLFYRNF